MEFSIACLRHLQSSISQLSSTTRVLPSLDRRYIACEIKRGGIEGPTGIDLYHVRAAGHFDEPESLSAGRRSSACYKTLAASARGGDDLQGPHPACGIEAPYSDITWLQLPTVVCAGTHFDSLSQAGSQRASERERWLAGASWATK
eukprot:GHVU01107859.1.p1 GENE.GHVU01107859.1~~GHVU01107859.1.p1  ORF type:complete len:146 (+),score=8.39 GHVU01107859.1:366-803(+)